MNIETFFETLDEFYNEIPSTGYACKFYCQANTFSFEIHDRSKVCFSKDSLKYESEVYSFWNNTDSMKEIINDIINSAVNATLK